MKTVLMTGAAGDVATHLRRSLAGTYQFRLSDIRAVTDLTKTETFRKAQLDRLSDVTRVVKGVDSIIHLGGFSKEGTWEEILQANIVGSYNLFEAARRTGVRRVVFASTNHVTGFHPRDAVVDHHADVRPDSRYGASKVFGEALGRLYVDKYGLEVCCIRIGNPTPTPADKRRLSIWTSPRDLAQLVKIGLEHPDIKFEIVYGVSGNTRSFYDNANALRLGYRPQDNSETFAAEVLKHDRKSRNKTEEKFQGGAFCTAGIIPQKDRAQKSEMTHAALSFRAVVASDFEDLLALRNEALHDSLARLGRLNPERSRARFQSGFTPELMRHVLWDQTAVGFVTVRPQDGVLLLEHLFLGSSHRNQGIGSAVLSHVLAEADEAGLDVRLDALRDSDANRLYVRHGFQQTGESEWDIHYVRRCVSPHGR